MQPHPLRQHFTNWLSEWWQEYFSRSFRNCTGRPWAFSWVEVQMRLVPLVKCRSVWTSQTKKSLLQPGLVTLGKELIQASFSPCFCHGPLPRWIRPRTTSSDPSTRSPMVSSYMSLLAPSETLFLCWILGGDVIGRSSDIHWYSICFFSQMVVRNAHTSRKDIKSIKCWTHRLNERLRPSRASCFRASQ